MQRLTFAVLSMALILSACGGNGGPEEEIDEYTEAFGNGDADTAWQLLSQRCQDMMDETGFRASVAASGEIYPDLEVTDYEESVDGDTAVVSYETSSSDIQPSGQRWIDEDGWKWDDC